MAIKGFKEIIDKKGYKVNPKDRVIFEREVGKAYFGLGISDMIEFIIFDSSDNQLPQGDSAQMVRYIPLDADNIRKYFLLTQNPSNMKMNGADEYIIDVEKLITEAGYSNGIFKTQVTLLNRRVGSENIGKDKLWIHEISPSRTEIRVLPLEDENEEVYEDLQKRLNIILKTGQFRDDTIYFVKSMVEAIKVEDVLKTFLTINGTVSSGQNYVKLIQAEFKIQNWELFIQQVREKLIEGAQYYVQNKDWNITSNNYGKPLNTPPDLELSVEKIVETLNSILIKVIDKYLPKRAIQEENILTIDEQKTLDEVKQILKTITSGTVYDTDTLQNQQGIVRGCTDPSAKNYNPLAQEDDGSCIYQSANVTPNTPSKTTPPPQPVEQSTITKSWYGWAPITVVKYKDSYGKINQTKIFEFAGQQLTYVDGSLTFEGDIREVSKQPQLVEIQPIEPTPVVTTPVITQPTSGGGAPNPYEGGGASSGYGRMGDASFNNVNYIGDRQEVNFQ